MSAFLVFTPIVLLAKALYAWFCMFFSLKMHFMQKFSNKKAVYLHKKL